jgi:hypothetical protein
MPLARESSSGRRLSISLKAAVAEIFISHSTKEHDPRDRKDRLDARAIRDYLFDGLGAAGHDVMLDQRCLKAGDDWYAKLYRWLGQCSGAVVIVDSEGLRSKWLRKEAAILSWRRSQIPGFRLITVLVGGISTTEVQEANLDDLLRYQTIKATRGVEVAAGEVVDAFAGFQAPADNSQMAKWIGDVAKLLEGAGGRLEAAARCLGVEQADREAYGDQRVTVAHALLHAQPKAAKHALQELLGMPGDAFRSLVRHVKPVCVNAAAGAALHRLIDHPPREAVVINAASPGVGRIYLDRARFRRQLMTDGVEIDGIAGEGGDRELEHALRHALLDGAAQNKEMPDHFRTLKTEEEQDWALDNYFDDPAKFFLLIGGSSNSALLGRLRKRMPAAAFILLPEFDEAGACAATLGAPIVEPRLDRFEHIVLLSHLTALDNLETEAG